MRICTKYAIHFDLKNNKKTHYYNDFLFKQETTQYRVELRIQSSTRTAYRFGLPFFTPPLALSWEMPCCKKPMWWTA